MFVSYLLEVYFIIYQKHVRFLLFLFWLRNAVPPPTSTVWKQLGLHLVEKLNTFSQDLCHALWCQGAGEQNVLTSVLITYEGNVRVFSEHTTNIQSSRLRVWEWRDPHVYITTHINKRSSVSKQTAVGMFQHTLQDTPIPLIFSPCESPHPQLEPPTDPAAVKAGHRQRGVISGSSFPSCFLVDKTRSGGLCIITILLVQGESLDYIKRLDILFWSDKNDYYSDYI